MLASLHTLLQARHPIHTWMHDARMQGSLFLGLEKRCSCVQLC